MYKLFLKRFYFAIFIILLLIGADQFSKTYAIHFLKQQDGYVYYVSQFFDIVYTWNYGISFGLFNQHKLSNIVFLLLNSAIILYLLVSYIFDRQASSFYLLIIGGGLGNIFDRFYRGAVFDFIHLHYQDYYFPVFNIADSFISIGIGLLLVEILFANLQAKKDVRIFRR